MVMSLWPHFFGPFCTSLEVQNDNWYSGQLAWSSVGFWLGGQCPLAAWGEENFQSSLVSLHPTPIFKKLLCLARFRFLIFHPFFQWGSADPICSCVRTPVRTRESGSVYRRGDDTGWSRTLPLTDPAKMLYSRPYTKRKLYATPFLHNFPSSSTCRSCICRCIWLSSARRGGLHPSARGREREREFIYQVDIHNIYISLLQWQAASEGISPS